MEKLALISLLALCLYLGIRLFLERRSYRLLKDHFRKDSLGSESLPGDLTPEAQKLGLAVIDGLHDFKLNADLDSYQRRFLEALLDEIKDGIVILDQNYEIRFLNQAAQLLFPSEQPYLSRPFIDVCRDHRIIDTIEMACNLKSKTSDQIDFRMNEMDGNHVRERTLQIEAEPLGFEEASTTVGAWLLLRDVTKELETEQIRQEFVANASHELRTPLSIINGYLETMDEEETDLNAPVFKRAIGTMVKHGDRIARLVEDMLTISRLESASNLLNSEPFNLVSSANEMISHLTPLIEKNHAKVKLNLNGNEAYYIDGDRYYWDQIFFNLIENALKQNPDQKLKIIVSFHEENGRIINSITDNGIGIPAADLPRIFKRFYRVQKHHSQTEIKGTGLGLSIVKRGIEAHRGTITIESIPGIETTFTISVPSSGAVPVTKENG